MSNNKVPVIVGVSQLKQDKDAPGPVGPLQLMEMACRRAMEDSGSNRLLSSIDTLYMTMSDGWSFKDPASDLCELLDIKPRAKRYSFFGGNIPQRFMNEGAKEIALGKCDAILFTGGEAEYAIRRQQKGEIDLNLPPREETENYYCEKKLSTSDFENDYNLLLPVGIYTFFETVLKEMKGCSWEEHIEYIGTILEHYSKVASGHHNSWTKKAYTLKEITTPADNNRYICYPYTLRMMANRLVDMSAAVIMTSTETAQKFGIEKEKWIYPMGGADIENIYYTTQRPLLHNSPAIYHGSRLALQQAGLSLSQIDIFDIYSCFPSMVQIFLNEIGLSADDPRGLTITGGLPFFGAPLNNYSMHAIVTAVEMIRKKPATKAMIAALGGMNSKPSFCIYGKETGERPWGERDDSKLQNDILSGALPEPTVKASGNLRIDGYAIHYGRDGRPQLGTVIGMLENGRRTLAHIDAAFDELALVKDNDIIGTNIEVKYDSERERNFIGMPV